MTILILTATGQQAVLIVEDEPIARNLMVSVLADSYQVLEADSAAEALAVSKGFESDIHLLIADHSLSIPEFRRLTRQLQLTRPHMKVLRICGDIREESVQEGGESLPAISFLERPFAPIELSNKVDLILAVQK